MSDAVLHVAHWGQCTLEGQCHCCSGSFLLWFFQSSLTKKLQMAKLQRHQTTNACQLSGRLKLKICHHSSGKVSQKLALSGHLLCRKCGTAAIVEGVKFPPSFHCRSAGLFWTLEQAKIRVERVMNQSTERLWLLYLSVSATGGKVKLVKSVTHTTFSLFKDQQDARNPGVKTRHCRTLA